MTHTAQKGHARCSSKCCLIGILVSITIFALIVALALFIFMPQGGFEASARIKGRSNTGKVVNATGIDNPAKADLSETPEPEKD